MEEWANCSDLLCEAPLLSGCFISLSLQTPRVAFHCDSQNVLPSNQHPALKLLPPPLCRGIWSNRLLLCCLTNLSVFSLCCFLFLWDLPRLWLSFASQTKGDKGSLQLGRLSISVFIFNQVSSTFALCFTWQQHRTWCVPASFNMLLYDSWNMCSVPGILQLLHIIHPVYWIFVAELHLFVLMSQFWFKISIQRIF